jgi:hypothetical protein
MSTTRPIKAWNILDCGLSRGVTGHHHWEAKALTDELVRRGHEVRLFTQLNAPDAAQFAGAELIPTFAMFLYQEISNDPMWSAIENFVVHNRSFHRDLSRLDPSMFEHAVTVFPTLGENQILGLVRWLAEFPKEKRPRVAIGLRTPQEFTPSNTRTQFYRNVFKKYLSEQGSGIAVFCRTAQSAAMTEKHVGVKANVFPVLVPDDLLSRRPRAPKAGTSPMMVSFVGGARRERGSALLPEIVKRCASQDVEFFIQVRAEADPRFDPNVLRALSGHPHVRVHNGAMAREDYYDVIANSITLIAYEPEFYRWRDSAVYHEAKLLDAPALVSAGTWMEDDVKALGNGLVIEAFTADAAAECIMRARRELPALSAAAVRAGRTAREKNGVARCLEAFGNACSSSGSG